MWRLHQSREFAGPVFKDTHRVGFTYVHRGLFVNVVLCNSHKEKTVHIRAYVVHDHDDYKSTEYHSTSSSFTIGQAMIKSILSFVIF